MSTARWRALAAHIRARINDGTYPVGGRIPSLNALMAEHGVSLVTARHAIQDLTAGDRPLLRTEQGVGTFVTDRPPRPADVEARLAELERRVTDLEAHLDD